MKRFICGLIVGIIISSMLASLASSPIIRNAYFNQSLSAVVDGISHDIRFITVELEGEEWGRNYLSAADITKAFGAKVDFDSKTQTMIFETDENKNKGDDSMSIPVLPIVDRKPVSIYTPDGLRADLFEDEYYVYYAHIQEQCKKYGYDIALNPNFNVSHISKDGEIIIDNIQYVEAFGRYSLKYEYYIDNIMPLFE